jgi:hypothetical protein
MTRVLVILAALAFSAHGGFMDYTDDAVRDRTPAPRSFVVDADLAQPDM